MDNKEKKVLVTGANGFIGSHLCERLIAKNYQVIGLSYGDKKNIKHLEKNDKFEIIEADITNFAEIYKIVKKCNPEAIFHIAGLLPSKDNSNNPLPFLKTNSEGTLNLLEACRLAGIKKFVYSSSMSVYGQDIKYLPVDEKHPINPYNFYSLTKWQGEEFLRIYSINYDLETVVLRYSGVYGLRKEEGVVAQFVADALNNKILEITGDTTWDIVYVKDVVEANIRALEEIERVKNEVINIGSGQGINIKDLAKFIIDSCDSKSKISIKSSLPLFHFRFDITKAKKLLSFAPLSIKEGLMSYIKEIKGVEKK